MLTKKIMICKTDKYFFCQITKDVKVNFKFKELYCDITSIMVIENEEKMFKPIQQFINSINDSINTKINEKLTTLIPICHWEEFCKILSNYKTKKQSFDKLKMSFWNKCYTDNNNTVHDNLINKMCKYIKQKKLTNKNVVNKKEFLLFFELNKKQKDMIDKISLFLKQVGYEIEFEEEKCTQNLLNLI